MSADRAAFGSGEVPDRGVEAVRGRGEAVQEYGAVVVDADAAEHEQSRAVVVNTPPVALDEWTAYRDENGEEVTVADDNPAYAEDAEVVVVAFEEDLDTERPNYTGESPLSLGSLGCRVYAFPPRRLRRVDHVAEESDDEAVEDRAAEDGTADEAQHPELSALAERVDGEVLVEDGEPLVAVERLGATHHISADGEVDGGPMAKQLTEAAAEVLGGDSE